MLRLAAVLLLAALACACTGTRYAQFARFADGELPEDDPFVGCRSAWTTPARLEMRCPAAVVTVDDRLRTEPYSVTKRWAGEEEARQQRALGGLDHAQVRLSVEEIALPDGEAWPILRAISLAGPEGLTPVEDVWLARAPFDRDGVRELRCAASGALGAERCARVLPALLARTPAATLPDEAALLEGCERERFPLHKIRGATRTRCRHVTLIEHDRVRELPEPLHLRRALGVASGSARGELVDVPPLADDGPPIEARGFVLTVGERVVWSGVLARDEERDELVHCAAELPPALGLRHCYRVVVLKLTGSDGLAVTPAD